jgi:hypothetical protein
MAHVGLMWACNCKSGRPQIARLLVAPSSRKAGLNRRPIPFFNGPGKTSNRQADRGGRVSGCGREYSRSGPARNLSRKLRQPVDVLNTPPARSHRVPRHHYAGRRGRSCDRAYPVRRLEPATEMLTTTRAVSSTGRRRKDAKSQSRTC